MKTVIASAIVALSFAAPAAADTSAAQAFFALSNDSAAERVINPKAGSNGPVAGATQSIAFYNDSAAERIIPDTAPLRRKSAREAQNTVFEAQQKFALDNDSAAERFVQ